MKRVLITGATSGIGEITAITLHQQGYTLFLTGRNEEKLNAIQTQLGERVYTAVANVVDYASISNVVQLANEKMGGIDAVVNNAGLGYFDPISQGKIEDWHEMIDVNIKGVLNVVHAALPHLIASRGQLIQMGSVASHYVFPNSGVYCATKHAVFAISESLRMELPDKIRVTTISPGSVNTPFIEKTHNEDLLATYRGDFAKGLTPQLVADQIAHVLNAPDSAVISEIVLRPNRNIR